VGGETNSRQLPRGKTFGYGKLIYIKSVKHYTSNEKHNVGAIKKEFNSNKTEENLESLEKKKKTVFATDNPET